MRAMVLREPRPVESEPLRLEEREVPSPGPGEVLLRVRANGVCRTDLHQVEGELAFHGPRVPGHQVVGVVEALGPQVEGLAVGQRVGAAWLARSCGRCAYCLRGEENLCPEARFTGWSQDGGYAEYTVAHAAYVYPLPEVWDDEEAAPLLCAGIIGYRSLRLAQVPPHGRLGLFGFGASASLTLPVALSEGLEVFVFTRSDAHRKAAREMGAAWAGGAEDSPPALLDGAILFAPVGALIPAALRHLRPGGTLAINAVHMDGIPAFPYPLLYGERTLRTVANATRRDGMEFLQAAAAVSLRPRVQSYRLDQANEALRAVKESRLVGAAVVVP